MADVYEFYNLGIGEPYPVSSVNKLGFGDLLDEVTSYFDKEAAAEEEDDRTKVAIVGKPNVGKSSIINRLIGENRVIVSDIAGTTRMQSIQRSPATEENMSLLIQRAS